MQRIEFDKNNTEKMLSLPYGSAEVHFVQFQNTYPFKFASIIMELGSMKNIVFQMYIEQVNQFVMPLAPFEEKWIKIPSMQVKVKINSQNNPSWSALEESAVLFLYYETR